MNVFLSNMTKFGDGGKGGHVERDCLGWKAHSGGGKGGHVEAEHEIPEKFLVRSK